MGKIPLEGENATSRDPSLDCNTSSKVLAVPAPTTAIRTLGLPAALVLSYCVMSNMLVVDYV